MKRIPDFLAILIELLEYIDAWVSRDNPRWRQFDAEHTEGARGENNGGGNTVYNHLPPGGRMFQLREGQKGFETWIREYDGRVVRHVRFDGERLKRAPGRGKPFGTWTEF